jgi:hypothetical protein
LHEKARTYTCTFSKLNPGFFRALYELFALRALGVAAAFLAGRALGGSAPSLRAVIRRKPAFSSLFSDFRSIGWGNRMDLNSMVDLNSQAWISASGS